MFIGGPDPRASVESGVTDLHARQQVTDLVTKLFVYGDEGRWDELAACFAPKVLLDMSSAGGAKPSRTSPKHVIELWKSGVRGLTASHHQLGNTLVSVEGDEASAFCYATASHYFPNATGGNVHTFVGTYDFHLSRKDGGWLIDAFRFNLKYEEGNLLLSELAKKASRES